MAVPPTPLTKTKLDLPLKEIPGDYGLPFFGALKDKLDFYWFQQLPRFYESRRDKYQSTVYRTNVAPGPPGYFNDPRVVMLLDQKSYSVLFDVDKVEKKDVFTGTYVPSRKFTGGYRVLPYLDPAEEMHAKLKSFAFTVLKRSAPRVFPAFHEAISECFSSWEASLSKESKVDFTKALIPATFKFNVTAFVGRDPFEPGENSLGKIGPTMTNIWVAGQLLPIAVLPLSSLAGPAKLLIPFLELFLHTFPIPYFLFGILSRYDKLIKFFRTYGKELLDVAEKEHGIGRDEATHNLLYYTLFNSWAGFKVFLPSLLKRLGNLSPEAQLEIANEVRAETAAAGGLTMRALDRMELVESAVFESLRMNPPVPFQYARAKQDLIIESHEAAFRVKKGELLAGFMPLASQDPVVFSDPTKFNPKRYVGDDGKQLLRYVLWGNGPQTEDSTVGNKHCAGKDFVPLVGKLLLAEIYSRYDFLKINDEGNLTSLIPAQTS